jgi:hypothetical protein
LIYLDEPINWESVVAYVELRRIDFDRLPLPPPVGRWRPDEAHRHA